ncbi:MAG: DUF3352 domain-containing protein [Treponema sp.]|nr:DUF3352 domain-containing protein [Treponema sp.]
MEEVVETKSESISKNTKSSKKKNPLVSFFLSIATIVLTLLVIMTGILAFSAFDRRSSLASVPRNYSLYLHTDSAFDTLNPLFDLQAADVLLSSPDFSSFRKIFMDFRSSEIRENSFFQFALSRPVDLALYPSTSSRESSHFLAVVNLGMFSFASRIASFIYPKIKFNIENISCKKNEQTDYYVYTLPEKRDENGRLLQKSSEIYIKSVKNLLIASDSFEHLLTACLTQNDSTYTPEQKKLFKGKKKGELRIVADAQSLLHYVTEGNQLLSSAAQVISSDSLSAVSFFISESDISVKCQLPMEKSSQSDLPLLSLISKKSTVPTLLPRLSDVTQYFTILNAGNLEELKNALLPFVPDIKNPDEFWQTSEDWCKSILDMDLEEFIFSWTGQEFAVLGIENQNDPVFVIQVKNEKQRQKVFNKLTSSILIQDDNSLILGGLRLPQLRLPPFISWILSLMKINMPSPYFMVLDGNIYFSESPESLSSIYTNVHSGKSLLKNENYQAISGKGKIESSLSLYYNLERSIPFFLKNNASFSRVLALYTMGRFDLSFDKNIINISLHACARKSGSLYSLPGFPLSLGGRPDCENLQLEAGKNPKNLFWVENESTIKALNLSSMKIVSKADSDKTDIAACQKSKNGGLLWSVSSHGMVNLLNSSLESLGNFPVMLGENVSVRPVSVGENLVVITDNGKVCIVKADSTLVSINLPDLSAKAGPAVLTGEDCFAIYSKGFMGKIYYFEGEKCLNQDSPLVIPGIGLGSPAIMKSGNKKLIAFITQAGEMNVWKADSQGEQIENFPMRLGGVFMINAAASEKYFYALSDDALLYRIGKDGSILTLQIPSSTAKHAYLSVKDWEGSGKYGIFVCADANIIYGFNENLELMSGYPLTGWGRPVFADVNGDKNPECLALTVDNKLVAWKTR